MMKVTASRLSEAAAVLSVAAVAASAVISFLYWDASDTTGTAICVAALAVSAAAAVISFWDLARNRAMDAEENEPLYRVMDSGPKHEPTKRPRTVFK
jgi:hypothetical protein